MWSVLCSFLAVNPVFEKKENMNHAYPLYSGYQEFLGIEAGFNPEVQSQFEVSFPPAATQLILMNICVMDYAYRADAT